jgi:hypothetical protein
MAPRPRPRRSLRTDLAEGFCQAGFFWPIGYKWSVVSRVIYIYTKIVHLIGFEKDDVEYKRSV